MAKGQKKSNREVRKPKAEETEVSKPQDLFRQAFRMELEFNRITV